MFVRSDWLDLWRREFATLGVVSYQRKPGRSEIGKSLCFEQYVSIQAIELWMDSNQQS